MVRVELAGQSTEPSLVEEARKAKAIPVKTRAATRKTRLQMTMLRSGFILTIPKMPFEVGSVRCYFGLWLEPLVRVCGILLGFCALLCLCYLQVEDGELKMRGCNQHFEVCTWKFWTLKHAYFPRGWLWTSATCSGHVICYDAMFRADKAFCIDKVERGSKTLHSHRCLGHVSRPPITEMRE